MQDGFVCSLQLVSVNLGGFVLFFLLFLYFLRSYTVISQWHFVKILQVFLFLGIFHTVKYVKVGSECIFHQKTFLYT